MLLGNASRGRIIAKEIVRAPHGWGRIFILKNSPPEPGRVVMFDGDAFWASFARAPVDVVFIDAAARVVGIHEGLRRWRSAGRCERAVSGLVLDVGACRRIPIREGDFLEFAPHTSERIAAGAHPG
ncbi:MAG: DUF192 domain-containing protein [Planctomycetes bacterium]|nr:DUF192 domain-containing protein [Planctomycetota bacterium]